MRKDFDYLLKNNSGAKSKVGLVEGFVVRTSEFELLMNLVQYSYTNNTPLNVLVLGPKGAGKTTILHRYLYGIEDSALIKRFLPIMFKEEQYNIVDTLTLWLRVVEYCEDYFGWHSIATTVKKLLKNPSTTQDDIYSLIKSELELKNQRLILFIENINEFFKKLGSKGQSEIKELAADGLVNIVGSSTVINDTSIDFNDPCFDYFTRIELKGLSQQECIQLLERIGKEFGKYDEIKTILENHPGRVEALRRLTGGVPRIIVYLFQIFLDNAAGKAMRDLYKLVDDLTDHYKGELNRLATQQLHVVDVLAKNWDAVAVKEIAHETRLESKNVSSILSTLEKQSVVERVKMESKNKLYRLKDRFLNIWYLMRHGRKAEKENVKWLVRFFDIWCDEDDLVRRAGEYMLELDEGLLDPETAVDMGNTLLSCKKLPTTVKYSLFEKSQKILPERVAAALRISDADLYRKIDDLIKQGKGSEAKDVLDKIDNKHSKRYYAFKSYVHIKLGEYQDAADATEAIVDLDPSDGEAAIALALIYDDFMHEPFIAEKHFHVALKAKHWYAATRLGNIEYYLHHNISKAEKYHRLAIKWDFKESYAELWKIFNDAGEHSKALDLSIEEHTKGLKGAHNRMGKSYQRLKMDSEAEKAFEEGIADGDVVSIKGLAFLELSKAEPSHDKVERLFLRASELNAPNSKADLGMFYMEVKKDRELGEKTWLEGAEIDDSESVHLLAHYYDSKKDFENSDKYYLQAIKLGIKDCIFCMASSVFRARRSDKKSIVLQLLTDNEDLADDHSPQAVIIFANFLLWNEHVDRALEKFRSAYAGISKILDADDSDAKEEVLADLTQRLAEFMIHLLARRQYKECLSLFEDSYDGVDLKAILKPIYYALMNEIKDQFPTEYLKAGAELQDTIGEAQHKIKILMKELSYN